MRGIRNVKLEERDAVRQLLEEFYQERIESQSSREGLIDGTLTMWSKGDIEILGKFIEHELVGIAVLGLTTNRLGVLSNRELIHDQSQSKDLERDLFDTAFERLKKRESWVGFRAAFLREDLIQYAQEKGFKKYVMIDMVVDRKSIEAVPMPNIPSGYTLESYDDKMNDEVANLLYESFKNSDSHNAEPDLLSTPERCLVFLDETINGRYGDFKNGKFSFVLKREDEIIGVTLRTLLNETTALAAAMSLDQKYRGKGLGKLQFLYSLKHLLKNAPSVSEIHLSVYDSNPAKYLYESVGFREVSRNQIYTWLEDNSE